MFVARTCPSASSTNNSILFGNQLLRSATCALKGFIVGVCITETFTSRKEGVNVDDRLIAIMWMPTIWLAMASRTYDTIKAWARSCYCFKGTVRQVNMVYVVHAYRYVEPTAIWYAVCNSCVCRALQGFGLQSCQLISNHFIKCDSIFPTNRK